jgi:hypothetical protein
MIDQQDYLHTPIYSKTFEMNTQSSDAKVSMQPINQLASRFFPAHIFLNKVDNCKQWHLKTKVESKTLTYE